MLRQLLYASTAALAIAQVANAHGGGSHALEHDRDPNRMSWGELHMDGMSDPIVWFS